MPTEFQDRLGYWMHECFGPTISADKVERNDRFIEEALELAQASGYSKDRAHALVDYVFTRPQGEINQEVGGVMVTLAALASPTASVCIPLARSNLSASGRRLSRSGQSKKRSRPALRFHNKERFMPKSIGPGEKETCRESAVTAIADMLEHVAMGLEVSGLHHHARAIFDIAADLRRLESQ